MLKAIVAVDKNGGIGYRGNMPWPNAMSDLAFFRQYTMGSIVAVGWNTFQSIPKPLKGRELVLISSSGRVVPGYLSFQSPEECVEHFRDDPRDIVFAGGKGIYEWAAENVDEFSITLISGSYKSDVYLFDNILKMRALLARSERLYLEQKHVVVDDEVFLVCHTHYAYCPCKWRNHEEDPCS